MGPKSAIEPTLTVCGGRIGDIRVLWVQDMGGTCPECTKVVPCEHPLLRCPQCYIFDWNGLHLSAPDAADICPQPLRIGRPIQHI
jgi:hypothetical protein